jgi:SAM-dependent methyltransferase
MIKPYAEACDRNQGPILSVIMPLLSHASRVLEIGSGTGQHAVYFASSMPNLSWYSSDRRENLDGIRLWLDEAALPNTPEPVQLDVTDPGWPFDNLDAVFSANTTHIMSWPEVEALVTGAGIHLGLDGLFILYGPFNYAGRYTSNSNEHFDHMLRQRDPQSGIRNFEDINVLAQSSGMEFLDDVEMPANNRILYWIKTNR